MDLHSLIAFLWVYNYQACHHFCLFFPYIDHTNSLILVLPMDLHSLIAFLWVHNSLCKSLIRIDFFLLVIMQQQQVAIPLKTLSLCLSGCWRRLIAGNKPFFITVSRPTVSFFFQMCKQFKAQLPVIHVHIVSFIVEVWHKFHHYSFTNTQFFHQCTIFRAFIFFTKVSKRTPKITA